MVWMFMSGSVHHQVESPPLTVFSHVTLGPIVLFGSLLSSGVPSITFLNTFQQLLISQQWTGVNAQISNLKG